MPGIDRSVIKFLIFLNRNKKRLRIKPRVKLNQEKL